MRLSSETVAHRRLAASVTIVRRTSPLSRTAAPPSVLTVARYGDGSISQSGPAARAEAAGARQRSTNGRASFIGESGNGTGARRPSGQWRRRRRESAGRGGSVQRRAAGRRRRRQARKKWAGSPRVGGTPDPGLARLLNPVAART